ncbi:helix-turn-helix domain-containing protein [Streptomyces calidiresistens]|uniref:Helix-turn-helix domain-containing protein n=1 Tax=Streptomyces calidiresistens TaxID=1485586 RepID=A0A7W3XXC6_9ACTN|nr:helix-turn-helix domain-containing protein [Streptomyces calidiresistens]
MSREAEEFAALLREVKERSGFSYGALARKLHTSTSTLHRYCNGEAVPMEYGAVERFARACRATPGELRELRLRWEAADEQRGRKAPPGPPEGSGRGAPPAQSDAVDPPSGAESRSSAKRASAAGPSRANRLGSSGCGSTGTVRKTRPSRGTSRNRRASAYSSAGESRPASVVSEEVAASSTG